MRNQRICPINPFVLLLAAISYTAVYAVPIIKVLPVEKPDALPESIVQSEDLQEKTPLGEEGKEASLELQLQRQADGVQQHDEELPSHTTYSSFDPIHTLNTDGVQQHDEELPSHTTYSSFDPIHTLNTDPHARARYLQSCAPPAVSNGYWSGSNPGQPSTSSGCSGCGSTQTSSTWTQSCNAPYFGTGSGVCFFTRSFSINRFWGFCRSCSAGGVSASWSTSSGGFCTACSPPAVASATSTYLSSWNWRWTCNVGAWGTTIDRTCSSTTGVYSGSAIVCTLCVPPAASNAVGVMTANSYSAVWNCNLGWYASQVTRTCNSGTGAFDGTAIACTACSPPVIANAVSIQQTAGGRPGVWRYTCMPGYFGAAAELSCDRVTGSFTGTRISCTACNSAGGGYYCVGGEDVGGMNSLGRYSCPAGTYGAPSSISGTSACTGLCAPGFYCPQTSITATANACGAANTYCPAGSSLPLLVPSGYYSTPLTSAESQRSSITICPAFRSCVSGVLLPPVVISTCPSSGTASFSVVHDTTNANFGPVQSFTTPGYTGSVVFSLGAITTFDPTCNAAPIQSSLSFDSVNNQFKFTSTYTVSSILCPNGFSMAMMVTRSADSTLSATCTYKVAVQQIPLAATFTACGPVSVSERSGVAAPVDKAVVATTANYGTSIFYSVDTSITPNVPFTIGLCDGVLRTTTDLAWKAASSYKVSVSALNDGSAVGIGSIRSWCNATVNIIQKPLLPYITVSAFSIPELTPVGQYIGNLNIVDPAGYDITSVVWASTDTPNAVAVDSQGNLTVASVVDTLVLGKTLFKYSVNVSTLYAKGTYPVGISFTTMPRPPTIFDQVRSIRQDAPSEFQMTPALNASSPQQSKFNFSIPTNSMFDITPGGVLFLLPGVQITFTNPGDYVYTVTVKDTNGLTASARVTITIIEVNRPPYWTNDMNGTWSYAVSERATSGTALPGGLAIAALDPNTRDSVVYVLKSWSPRLSGIDLNSPPFTIHSLTGVISVGVVTGNILNFDQTLSYTIPQTFFLNVSARDLSGAEVNGTVWLRIKDIYPRVVTPATVSVSGSAQVEKQVALLSTYTWTPYPTSQIQYYSDCELRPDGRNPFVTDLSSGNMTVAAGAADPMTGIVTWDFNAKSSFKCNVTATDILSSRSTTARLTINLAHVNRPPTWGLTPFMYTPAKVSLNIGTPLNAFVNDPDIWLNIGENLTFVLDPEGNTDSTFGINSRTGQLYVADNNTASFVYPFGGPGPNYTLTVNVTDAGIDGPRYTVSALVLIVVTGTTLPPTINYASFSVPEHSVVGTVVGTITASSPTPGAPLSYTLAPADGNVNKPFPFSIVTEGNAGRILVAADGPINYSPFAGAGEFRRYSARVTVIDSHRGYPLTAQTDIAIDVTWVKETPFFDPAVIPPAYRPNAYTFFVSVDELSLVDTVVSAAGTIVGASKDPWTTLSYSWAPSTSALLKSYFAIDPVSAQVTLKAGGAAVLDFETTPSYQLKVVVNDTGIGLQDTATVVIDVNDVNDPAVFTDLTNANRNILAVNYLSVFENTTGGGVVGYVLATDADRTPLWGSIRYDLAFSTDLPNDPTGYAYTLFGIDPISGGIYVRGSAPLDWNTQDTWNVVVAVTDSDPYNPITVNRTVMIRILQCNTVTITSIYASNNEVLLGNAILVPSSIYASTHASNDVLCKTTGCTVQLWGTGFGKTATRLAHEGFGASTNNPTVISATYGPRGTEYSAVCTVLLANTQLECTVPAGVGRDHVWIVMINNAWTHVSTVKFGYMPPVISAVYRSGTVSTDPTQQTMRTDAFAEFITIEATNLGPKSVNVVGNVNAIDFAVRLRYGPTGVEYVSPICFWERAHEEVSCRAVPGIGRDHIWQVTVGFQTSTGFTSTSVRYTTPAITAVSAPVMDTRGGATILLNGTNFGPADTTRIVTTYSSNFASGGFVPVYQAVACFVPLYGAHVVIVCKSVPGMGKNMNVFVTVADQQSALSTGTLAYQAPIIRGLSGLGTDRADTKGGQAVVIEGDQFGPLTDSFANGTTFGLYIPTVRYGRRSLAASLLPYVAVDCRVTTPHTGISCLTTEGTGKDLVWNVIIGGQESGVLLTPGATTSYHPPIVAYYSGPGSNVAETYGQQYVLIEGRHMGPVGTVPDKVTYGITGVEFTATGCYLATAHELLNCTTVVGASKSLMWKVFIDGQESTSPKTNYGQPIVDSFSGPAAIDASTDGGQRIVLYGRFFSVQEHLGTVTYGTSGTEYMATNCSVLIAHEAMQCTTVPGTGRVLRWIVQVGNQFSEPSTATTSYAVANITAVIPSNSLTNGGLTITLEARNAGLRYLTSQLEIRINAIGSLPPSQQDMDAHWSDVRAGRNGDMLVWSWIRNLPALPPTYTAADANGKHTIAFIVPPGFGPSRELFLVVDGIPSDIVPFTYDAPVIANIAPDRQNVTVGQLRVFIDGTSFCDGNHGCGEVLLNGVRQQHLAWSHEQVMFVIPDLPSNAPDQTLQIVVAGVGSNIRYFRKPVPNFDALVGQDTFKDMDTMGGQPFSIKGVADIGLEPVNITIGGRPCTDLTRAVDNGKLATDSDATFTLTCRTPEGVGLSNQVIVTALGGSSRATNDFVVDYAAPRITDVRRIADSVSFITAPSQGSIATIPTVGEVVSVVGTNLGTANLDKNALFFLDVATRATILVHTHTELSVAIPAGDGIGHQLQFSVGVQDSNSVVFAYTAPTVSGIAPDSGPTVGGQTVTITGSNFGISKPNVTIGSMFCTLSFSGSVYAPAAAHDTIRCRTPNYEGGQLPVIVSVNGQDSTTPAAASASTTPVVYSYLPPVVHSISPNDGPTSGGTQITLLGTNLGTGGSGSHITFLPDSGSRPEDVPIPVPPSNILFWNDTVITFIMPEGYGARLVATVYAGNQPSTPLTQTSALYAYDPPSVRGWWREDRHNCQDFERVYYFGNETFRKPVPMQCFDTRGEYSIEIFGASFSTRLAAASVSIGGRTCLLQTITHDRLKCRAPRGLGDINDILVTVGGRVSVLNGSTTNFAYDPPVIDAIIPNTPNALGANVTVRGKNFGFDETIFIANISGVAASSAVWLGDGSLLFTTVEDIVGPKRIELSLANRSTPYIFYEFEQIFISECKNGYWGLVGELCLECPRGAKCPGGEQEADLLLAKPGFWRAEVPNPSPLCPVQHRDEALRPQCPTFAPCEPPTSCLGNNVCAEGYAGARCALCLKGKYYRVNGECIKCPDSPIAVIIVFILLALLALLVSWAFTKYNVTIALISIGIDYAQVVSIFSRTRIRWPAIVKQIFLILSAFNVNLELAAPECLLENVTFYNKWLAIEMLPLLAIVFLGIMYTFKLCYKAACLNKKKKQLHSHLPQLVSVFIVAFRVLYLFLTRSALDVFNCSPTDPPDGNQYMSGMLDVICWQPGTIQTQLLPYGILAIIFYVAGLPLVTFFFLRRRRNAIKYDQILRVQGLGDDRRTNPQFYMFRKTWHKLYYHFAPGKWYWEGIILARKFLIAFTSLMFRSTPSYQLAVALLVLFVAFVLHVRNSPYITHANRADIVRNHMAKVYAGDPLHRTIEADMRSVAKANQRNSKKATSLSETAKADDSESWSVATSALRRAFEYNTVEAVLLGCCILINLAGIMFDSARFQGELAQYYQQEYESLTYATIALIMLSIIYYLWCLLADIIVTCSPSTAALLCTCTRIETAVEKIKKANVGHRRTGSKVIGSSGSGGAGSVSMDADGEEAKNSINMMSNPFMLQANARGGSGGANSSAAAAAGKSSNGFNTREIEAMSEIPDKAVWAAIRTGYVVALNTADDLSKELAELKRNVASGKALSVADEELEGAVSSSVRLAQLNGVTGGRQRTFFEPMRAGDSGKYDSSSGAGGVFQTDDSPVSPRYSTSNTTTQNPLSSLRSKAKFSSSGSTSARLGNGMSSLKQQQKSSGSSPRSTSSTTAVQEEQ